MAGVRGVLLKHLRKNAMSFPLLCNHNPTPNDFCALTFSVVRRSFSDKGMGSFLDKSKVIDRVSASYDAITEKLNFYEYKLSLTRTGNDIYFIGGFGTVAWIDVKEYGEFKPDKIVVDGGEQNLKIFWLGRNFSCHHSVTVQWNEDANRRLRGCNMKFRVLMRRLFHSITQIIRLIEINTADAQKSYMEGVTGCLTGKDKFAQSFFLCSPRQWVARVRNHGFSEHESLVVRALLISKIESTYLERDQMQSTSLRDEYIHW
ncbi:hypothetical protein GQ457_09G013920 [Hibiscus cannabinus]